LRIVFIDIISFQAGFVILWPLLPLDSGNVELFTRQPATLSLSRFPVTKAALADITLPLSIHCWS
jgi:hypothetical protein